MLYFILDCYGFDMLISNDNNKDIPELIFAAFSDKKCHNILLEISPMSNRPITLEFSRDQDKNQNILDIYFYAE